MPGSRYCYERDPTVHTSYTYFYIRLTIHRSLDSTILSCLKNVEIIVSLSLIKDKILRYIINRINANENRSKLREYEIFLFD